MNFSDSSSVEHESIRRALQESTSFVNGLVLDAGCGARPYEQIVVEAGGRYVGIDVEIRGNRGADVVANSLNLPFKDETFNTILSTQVIEHVRDPSRLMEEAARVLKRGGHLILTAPMMWPLHEEPYDFFRFTRFGLECLVEHSGLTCMRLDERTGGWRSLAQLLALTLNDIFGKKRFPRVLSKLVMVPVMFLATLLDRLLPYRKLTLGYLLIAKK